MGPPNERSSDPNDARFWQSGKLWSQMGSPVSVVDGVFDSGPAAYGGCRAFRSIASRSALGGRVSVELIRKRLSAMVSDITLDHANGQPPVWPAPAFRRP